MKSADRDPILFGEDIVLSMERVHEYLTGLDFEHFKRDHTTLDAVIRNFEVIGESSKNLPKSIKDQYPHVPWEEMYRLRNRISHQYFGIDFEIIWNIATMQLPLNYQDVVEILHIKKSAKE